MIELFFTTILLSFPVVSAFSLSNHVQILLRRRYLITIPSPGRVPTAATSAFPPNGQSRTTDRVLAMGHPPSGGGEQPTRNHTWSPQDLTRDTPGCLPLPEDDYIKKYQRNPELWPVELFLIAYRRTRNQKTQVLVRASANGTARWGLGTGVPATRWWLSAQESPPRGYRWSSRMTFEADNFPEFPEKDPLPQSWTYRKIDIREDAFDAADVRDPELEDYANRIRTALRSELRHRNGENISPWERSTLSVVQTVLDRPNSVPAIQGTLRMSGLFAPREGGGPRYIGLGPTAPDPARLVRSMRIYTMFPQMPDPMPLPSTPPEALRKELATRDLRMKESGRDPHEDKYGRKYTHRSTSNVSNTIHGVYLTVDVTDLPGLEEVPAMDLFGSKNIQRHWISLEDLRVLDETGSISTEDPKPTFISGFIVRQLVQEGVIHSHG